MASYLPIVLLVCLQITGGLSQSCRGTGQNRICDWQIAVIVLLSIILAIIVLGFLGMICCGAKMCKQNQCSNDVYLQNIGCRGQQQ